MATAIESEPPRTFAGTLRDILAVVTVSAVTGLIWLPIVTLPTFGGAILAEGIGPTIAFPALFGVYLGGTVIGVKELLERQYSDEDTSADLAPREFLALLFVMATYMNLQLLAGVVAAVLVPTASVLVALLVPMVDKALVSLTGHSPLFLFIRGLVAALETIGVRGIDLDVVGDGSLVAVIS
ncbi:hypothetical protein [Halorhabdus tiamatea]|nr:hypothetical protein [Halorhabdus tiamatea]CCQ34291.1 hypothetical protein HTIA_2179 [Halorhabdus tiamatea SARL4B]